MKKHSKYRIVLLTILGLTIILNLAGLSRDFCNFYADNVYGAIRTIVGTLTSWCPVAIGEIIMYLGAVAVVLLVIFAIISIFLRKKDGYRHFVLGYAKAILMTAVIFLFVYTTNWFIPYRCDVVKVSDNERTTYSFEELGAVYNFVVSNLNTIAVTAPRDDNGRLIYDYTEADIAEAMRNMSSEFGRLAGGYSNPKAALCSPFLDWMGIGGYNYIFTMEPTYNRFVGPLDLPALLAHEYAHHKGYYKENEGEFLGCLGMAKSDNIVLQYSGLYEMYRYLEEDFEEAFIDYFEAKYGEPSIENLEAFIMERQQFLYPIDQVFTDVSDSFAVAKDLYQSEVPAQMEETFSEASEEIADTGWEIQGDVIRENSYDGMTLMLMQYLIKD